MADLFKTEVLTPDRKLLDTQASSVFIPASDGEVEVLANHCDFIGSLGQGILTVNAEEGTHRFAISKGLFQVINGSLNILSASITTSKDITLDLVDIKIEKLNKKLSETGISKEDVQFLKDELRYAQAQRKMLGGQ